MKQTHKTRLIYYLRQYKSITTLQAIKDLGNTRLSAYIFALRKDGYNIINDNIRVTTRWGTKTTVSNYILKD